MNIVATVFGPSTEFQQSLYYDESSPRIRAGTVSWRNFMIEGLKISFKSVENAMQSCEETKYSEQFDSNNYRATFRKIMKVHGHN